MAIEAGQRYGYRKQRYSVGMALRPVLVTKLGPAGSGKCRIRWLDGEYEGMEEWVSRGTLLCPWDQAGAYVEDELKLATVVEHSRHAFRNTEWWAVWNIFGELDGPFDLSEWVRYNGAMVIKDFPATTEVYGLVPGDLLAEPYAFVDRNGMYTATFATALKIAQMLCRRDPDRILEVFKRELRALESASRTGHYVMPDGSWERSMELEHARERWSKMCGVYDVISTWCGRERRERMDELFELRDEVTRLSGLLNEVLKWMRETASERNLPWLRAKFAALYKTWHGQPPPPLVKQRKRKNGPSRS